MLLKDALIVWTPNRAPFENLPTAGKIAVTTLPEPDALKAHPSSYGASDIEWTQASNAQRHKLLSEKLENIAKDDQLDPSDILDSLGGIDDIDTLVFKF
ncbi:hypothetical protein [Mesorhizobium silamurunense]|uniref:hypothetical protein n=1 Tax=Mesorhizobium silamurunense TaxID=499528 RepID=UPI0017835C85|nr:hypothetical protein [Mesorhizobium silamurunense]